MTLLRRASVTLLLPCWLATGPARAQQTNVVEPPEEVLPAPPEASKPTGDNQPGDGKPTTARPAPESPTGPAPPVLPLSNGPQAPAPRYQSLVRGHKPSPAWTQDRNFASTRFWLLDPGQFAVETWLYQRFSHELGGSRAPNDWLWQNEFEIGVAPHLQIDIYENLALNPPDGDPNGARTVTHEGVQLEARIAIPSYYGQIFGNPTIYLEWHPRRNNPDRAEIRLLLGGAIGSRVFVAVNPYLEGNVEKSDNPPRAAFDMVQRKWVVQPTASSWVYDAEVGATVAAGVKVADWLRITGQLKIGGDMLGDPKNAFHFVAWAGPGILLKPLPGKYAQYLKINYTLLIDCTGRNWDTMELGGSGIAPQQFDSTLVIASQF